MVATFRTPDELIQFEIFSLVQFSNPLMPGFETLESTTEIINQQLSDDEIVQVSLKDLNSPEFSLAPGNFLSSVLPRHLQGDAQSSTLSPGSTLEPAEVFWTLLWTEVLTSLPSLQTPVTVSHHLTPSLPTMMS